MSVVLPQIAATIVHLGVELGTVVTKATLAAAFSLALQRTGQTIQHKRRQSAQEDGRGSDSDS
jgi:rsbT co-antagonist protein RsbR